MKYSTIVINHVSLQNILFMFSSGSKFIIENVLETLPTDSTTLDLSNRQLTTLTHLDSMVTMETIKLSGNCLRELPDLAYLQCVQAMVLDGNRIHSCRNFRHLSSLEELSICDNSILSNIACSFDQI